MSEVKLKHILVKSKNPILQSVAEEVAICSKESLDTIDKLKTFLNANPKSKGLSAPQIGIALRIAVCYFKGIQYVIQNPVVEWKFGSARSLERCLSSDGAYFVKRPLICKISWINENGTAVEKIMGYKQARVFLHEIDHLNGICISKIGKYYKYTNAALAIMEKQEQKGKVKNHGKDTRNTAKA